MKKEFDEDKITKNKLKDPFYRLDYFKEYAFILDFLFNNFIQGGTLVFLIP